MLRSPAPSSKLTLPSAETAGADSESAQLDMLATEAGLRPLLGPCVMQE